MRQKSHFYGLELWGVAVYSNTEVEHQLRRGQQTACVQSD